MWQSLAKMALGLLPIQKVVDLVFGLLASWAASTATTVDDQIVSFLHTVEKDVLIFDGTTIKLNPAFSKQFKGLTVDGALRWIINTLKVAAQATDTDADDELVALVEGLLVKSGLLSA